LDSRGYPETHSSSVELDNQRIGATEGEGAKSLKEKVNWLEK